MKLLEIIHLSGVADAELVGVYIVVPTEIPGLLSSVKVAGLN